MAKIGMAIGAGLFLFGILTDDWITAVLGAISFAGSMWLNNQR